VKPDPNRNLWLVTADVESLYPSIPLKEACQVTSEFIKKLPLNFTSIILEMCKQVLLGNTCWHNGTLHLQIDGVATGSPLAPVVANLFMQYLETPVINKWTDSLKTYKRYIDDIAVLFQGTASELQEFMDEMNNMHPSIKLTWTTSSTSMEYLDLVVFKGKRWPEKLDYRVHQKTLNKYLYLPWKSFHPRSQKSSMITAEVQRYIRNSSSFEDYIRIKRLFRSRLRARGYPREQINRSFLSVTYKERQMMLAPNNGKDKCLTPLVFKTQFDPFTASLNWGKLLNPKPFLQESKLITAYSRSANLFQLLKRSLTKKEDVNNEKPKSEASTSTSTNSPPFNKI
jgi:hypothetical protein